MMSLGLGPQNQKAVFCFYF